MKKDVADRRRELEETIRKVLEGKCNKIEEERSEEKTLFYCGGELAGSVVLLDEEILAGTVYSQKISDSVHREFLDEAKKVFGRDLLEKGTKLSTGVEQNFYYSYIHVKL